VLLRREGWLVNPKRVCRLYREMGLQLRNKSPKRRVKAQLREDRAPASGPNQVWAMDFVHDQLFDGRKIRVLTVVDTFTRLSPAIEVRQQFRGADVVEVLERVSRKIGYPKTIRVDNGPEFVSKDLDLWAFLRSVTLDFSRPGKPTDNAFNEIGGDRWTLPQAVNCVVELDSIKPEEARRQIHLALIDGALWPKWGAFGPHPHLSILDQDPEPPVGDPLWKAADFDWEGGTVLDNFDPANGKQERRVLLIIAAFSSVSFQSERASPATVAADYTSGVESLDVRRR
jgi:integrase-like protein